MANLGMADTLILMVLALVVFGPRRLPQIGRQIGKLMYEFRKASNDFKFQMEEELRNAEEADRRKKEEEERQRALAAAPPQPQLKQTTSPDSGSNAAAPESEAPAPAAPEVPYADPYEGLYQGLQQDESPAASRPQPRRRNTAGRSRRRACRSTSRPTHHAANSATLHRRDRCGRAPWHATPATGTFRRRPGQGPGKRQF